MSERLMGLYQAACASFITGAWRMGENAGLCHTSWGTDFFAKSFIHVLLCGRSTCCAEFMASEHCWDFVNLEHKQPLNTPLQQGAMGQETQVDRWLDR